MSDELENVPKVRCKRPDGKTTVRIMEARQKWRKEMLKMLLSEEDSLSDCSIETETTEDRGKKSKT